MTTRDAPVWRTFRALVKKLGPKWLVRETVEVPGRTPVETDNRTLYTTALVRDAFAERIRLGVLARFPIADSTPADALAEIGADRRVFRGPDEPEAAFCERARRWLDDWRLAGSPWSILEQVRAYCSPHAVRVRIYTNRGDCYTINRDGTRSRARDTAWDWDGDTTRWARWWLVIYPDAGAPFAAQAVYGTAEQWGAVGGTWGSTATEADVLAVRRIIRDRKPAGTRCDHVIVCHSDTHFDPADALTLPDGTWGSVYKLSGGSLVKARFDGAAYWPGA